MYTILGLDEFLDKYFPSIYGKNTEAKYRLLGKFDCSHKRSIVDKLVDQELVFSYMCDLNEEPVCKFEFASGGLMARRVKGTSRNEKGYLDFYPYDSSSEICSMKFRPSSSNFSMYDFVSDIKSGVSDALESIITSSIEVCSYDDIKVYLSSKLKYFEYDDDYHYTAWLTLVRGAKILNLCKLYFDINTYEIDLYDPYRARVYLDKHPSNYIFNLLMNLDGCMGYRSFVFSKDVKSDSLKNLSIS